MSNASAILLLVSDQIQSNRMISSIQDFGFNIFSANKYEDGIEILSRSKPDVAILDSSINDIHWREAALNIKEISKDISILLVTPHIIKDDSLNPNIDGVIKSPVDITDLRDKITRYMNKGNDFKSSDLKNDAGIDDPAVDCVGDLLLGQGRRITEIKNIIRRVAQPDITVLLRGESGTGKELAAQAIYRYSHRKNKPFVKVLCAAIPEGLLESELFGHEKGAFTGAHRMKPGKFEFANRGTIFLDEIGDIPQSLQAKLLQVLQDGEFSRIGGREVEVDVRVIAATNKNLERAVVSGSFREDLFYRLNVVSITMPSLRERKEDIPVLTEYFLQKYCNIYNKDYRPISQETMNRFASYRWPGNVRELENIVKRIIVLGSEKVELSGCSEEDEEEISETDQPNLAPVIQVEKEVEVPEFKPRRLKEIAQEAVSKAEEEAIRKTLFLCKWNRRKAAEMLSISYKTLFYKMRQYNLFD